MKNVTSNTANASASASTSGAPASTDYRRPVSGLMKRVLPDDDASDSPTVALAPKSTNAPTPESARAPGSQAAPIARAPDSSQAVPLVQNDEPISSPSLTERGRALMMHQRARARSEDEEVTCISTPRPFFDERPFFDDDESTRQYNELPTRVMVPDVAIADESSERVISPPSSRSSSELIAAPAKVLVIDASASLLSGAGSRTIQSRSLQTPAPQGEVGTSPSVHVGETRASVDPLAVDRALLRAIGSPHGRPAIQPIVAMRPAAPSPRLLAIVAAFTALGMLWVLAVAAMILSFVAR